MPVDSATVNTPETFCMEVQPQADLSVTELDIVCDDVHKADKKLYSAVKNILSKYPDKELGECAPSIQEVIVKLVKSGFVPKQKDIETIDSITIYLSGLAYIRHNNRLI